MPGRVGRWEGDSGKRKRLKKTLHGLHFIKNLQFGEKHENGKVIPLVILPKDRHKKLGLVPAAALHIWSVFNIFALRLDSQAGATTLLKMKLSLPLDSGSPPGYSLL